MNKLLFIILLSFLTYSNSILSLDNSLKNKSNLSTTPINIKAIIEKIFNLLQSGENLDYIGEPISQLEHALQCAQGARDAQADTETIIAALLHDIGHLCKANDTTSMGTYGVMSHEKIGANFVLECGFSQKVADLIDGHVQAKRYLTYKDPNYFQQLSPASVQTLTYQGGPMTHDEAKLFEQDPLFERKLQIRRWDEAAKVIGADVAPLHSYKVMISKHLKRQILRKITALFENIPF